MNLNSSDFHSPGRLICEVASRATLSEGTVHLALVARPATEQRIECSACRSPTALPLSTIRS